MTALARTDPDLVVLHSLRCSGAVSLERLAANVAPLVSEDVETLLLDLAAQGLATRDSGTFGGWRVTDAGRTVDAERITQELDGTGGRAEIQAAYEEFRPLNKRTLDLCGEWQVRSFEPPMVLNDHTDKAYDGRVLAKFAAHHVEAQGVCDRLAACLHRFSQYGTRLSAALRRARAGELDLVTDSLDSYHSVWFQLHEDLLVTLGIPRAGS